MISKETETKLSDLFFLIISQESQIELSRFALSKLQDFDPFSAFQHLDVHSLSSLSPTEFQLILNKYSFFSCPGEAYQLIKQYDSNKNGRLSFNEFLQLVLPSTNPGFRELALSRRGFVSSEVEYFLVKVIQQEVLYHRTLEDSRRELVARPDFNLLEAFRAVDTKGNSFIDRESLSRFLSRFKPAFDHDLDALFRRIDNDGDSVISYLEFVDAVMPYNRKHNSPRRPSPGRENFASPLRLTTARHWSPLRRSPEKLEIRHQYPVFKEPHRSPGKTVQFSEIENRDFSIRRAQVHYHSRSLSSVVSSPEEGCGEVKELVLLLDEELKFLRNLESFKNNLCLKNDFNLVDAFRMFDLNDNGFISLPDIENTLNRIGFRPTQDQIYLLVKHYSRLQDNKLGFSDFSEMLSPKQEEYARIIRNKNPLNIAGLDRFLVFGRDTLGALLSCFEMLFEFEVLAERQRQRISRIPWFNLFLLFNTLDKGKNGFITVNELRDLFSEYRVVLNGRDMHVIMQKFDKNCDGRISYSEFIDEITPKSSHIY